MGAVGLITGLVAALLGLYLLAIWLIEYDRDFHAATATRLPIPVLAGHIAGAASGLALWAAYLILDRHRLATYSLYAFLAAAALGLIMALRWYRAYRAKRDRQRAAAKFIRAPVGYAESPAGRLDDLGPPERNFPLPVVISHGLFAVVTICPVLLSILTSG